MRFNFPLLGDIDIKSFGAGYVAGLASASLWTWASDIGDTIAGYLPFGGEDD